jgi:hypothetical protein
MVSGCLACYVIAVTDTDFSTPDKDARIAELEAALAAAHADISARDILIDTLRVQIARLKRMQFGQSSEKLDTQIAQLELALEEAEAEAMVADARRAHPASVTLMPRVTLNDPEPLPAALPATASIAGAADRVPVPVLLHCRSRYGYSLARWMLRTGSCRALAGQRSCSAGGLAGDAAHGVRADQLDIRAAVARCRSGTAATN